MYATKYIIPFKTLSNKSAQVEIQKDGYTGSTIELTGGVPPITVSIKEKDFLYETNMLSSATLKIVGSDYLQELFSVNYHDWRVVLTVDGQRKWVGFISPEVYSQDYTKKVFEFEIECISALSTLEYIKYSNVGAYSDFVTMLTLLKKAVTASKGDYAGFYLPNTCGFETADINTIRSIKVSERQFFDNDGKPETYMEVLDQICQFFSWKMVDWKSGEIFFVDIDHTGSYYYYNIANDTFSLSSLTPSTTSVQSLGFKGSDSKLDKIAGWNKASIRAKNNLIGDIFPTEDYKTLEIIYDETEYNTDPPITGTTRMLNRYYKPNEIPLKVYTNDANQTEVEYLGAYPSKMSQWLGATAITRNMHIVGKLSTDDENSNLIRVRVKDVMNPAIKLGFKPVLVFENIAPAGYMMSALDLNLSIQGTNDSEMRYFKENSFSYGGTKLSIRCRLKIGEYYYQGIPGWSKTESYFDLNFDIEEFKKGKFVPVTNNKQESDPYADSTGYLIKFPEYTPVFGPVTFKMYPGWYDDDEIRNSLYGYFIKGLSFSFKIPDTSKSAIPVNSDNGYENVVNSTFLNELDEIDFKLNSWNFDEPAYSKPIKIGTEDYFVEKLYNVAQGENLRPETLLLTKIIEQYDQVKDKLTLPLKLSDTIYPLSYLSDDFKAGKRFTITGGKIDYSRESFNVKMIEAK